ncbi:flagellar biosynthetic protein FliP [Desulforamulus reducens MI-1]|uniref:Flagellar biosynthetic protein FliP n=1 Tax=Desulforamulus reducens (strain ATCC BAA-1160 / DSM 100696 / MI-1) TaxID=349161 RepID=A4J753_DESRM|nr:flagellar type III secretion system pore protein FliP [Desulforamulus reducens]ABO50906.1 flagellar biosynthetic protein FliP [Desulforamulus reducens MI-1]
MVRKKKINAWIIIVLTALLLFLIPNGVFAEPLIPIPSINLNVETAQEPQQVVDSVKLLIFLTLLSMVPAFLMMLTSFTRIIVVLSFLRSALGTQQTPPNQVLIGLALFLTIFIMNPVYQDINKNSIQPYLANQLTYEQATDQAAKPLRNFMVRQTREKDLGLFLNIAKMDKPKNANEVPMSVLVPAFVISELKTAFQIGFILFVPFLVIDMVVASTLMSMGMFMLPPVMVALPFKLLLFVMVDGWYLVVKSLVESFR